MSVGPVTDPTIQVVNLLLNSLTAVLIAYLTTKYHTGGPTNPPPTDTPK